MVVPLQPLTLAQLLDRTACRFPQRIAIESPSQRLTYQRLAEQTRLAGAGLLALGVRPGDHVAVWSDLSPAAIVLFYAIQRIGAVAFPLNPDLPERAASCLLERGDVRLVAAGPRQQAAAEQLALQMPSLRVLRLLPTGSEPEGVLTLTRLTERGRQISRETMEQAEARVRPEDAAVMLLTSGTTGRAKMVLTSHYSRVNSGIQQAHDMGARASDRFLVALPMFHCFCLGANLYAALAVGACLWLPASRHTADLIVGLREGRCTILHAVPTQFRALIDSPSLRPGDAGALRTGIIGGGGYSPRLFCRIEETLGMTLLSSLGMTEATAGVTVSRPEDSLACRSTTVGRFMDHLEGKIVSVGSGEELPIGGSGEICVRGYGLMMGYYREEALTAGAIDSGGWLHSGDFGFLDEAGCLHLEGRIKELIIRGGENVSPLEVETAMLEVPGVLACKVVGIPDVHFGEEVGAVVVREPGSAVTEKDIRARLGKMLERFKIPTVIVFLDKLPLNSVGKVDLQAARELAAAHAARQGEPDRTCGSFSSRQ